MKLTNDELFLFISYDNGAILQISVNEKIIVKQYSSFNGYSIYDMLITPDN